MNNHLHWHKQVILNFLKDNAAEIIGSLLASLAFLFWVFFSGEAFAWKDIEPISMPPWSRMLMSALVFGTSGAFLYFIRFYQILHIILVEILGLRGVYVRLKEALWGGMMLAMYLVIIPLVVKALNAVASFFYNTYAFILYLWPPLAFSVLVLVGVLVYNNRESLKSFNPSKRSLR